MNNLQDAMSTPLLMLHKGVGGGGTEDAPWWRNIKRKKVKLSYKDQLNKNWIQKWLHYGRFPFKFVVHVLLVVACTWMVYLVGGYQASNSTHMSASYCQMLLEDNCDQSDYTPKKFYVYSINETVDVVSTALQNFELLPQTVLGKVTLHPPATLIVDSYVNCDNLYDTAQTSVDTSTSENIYDVNSTDWGPLNDVPKLSNFFQCLQEMTLQFEMSSVHVSVDSRPIEYMWIIYITFTNEGNTGRLSGNFDTDRYPVLRDTPVEYLLQTRVILNIVIIVLGVTSQVLHWMSIIRSIKIFLNIKLKVQKRGQTNKSPLTWNSLPLSTKLRFFNIWFVLAIVGCLCNIVGAMLDIILVWQQNIISDMLIQVVIGTGAALAWAYMTHYLEFNRKYTVLIDALVRGLPDVLRFAAGAIPVYIGFAIFGYAAFSESTRRFSTFGESFVTLFGIQNGDDMQASFRSLNAHMVVSRIYFFIFSIISIYTIANIFIAIIGNAFHSANNKLRKEDPNPSAEEEERVAWESIMGMNTDSDKSDTDNTTTQQSNSATNSAVAYDSGNEGVTVAPNVVVVRSARNSRSINISQGSDSSSSEDAGVSL